MCADEFSDPVVVPITITITIPNPFRRQSGEPFDPGPTHHPSFTDPTWFARQRRAPAPASEAGGDPSGTDPTSRFPSIKEFKQIGEAARQAALGKAGPPTPLTTRLVYEETDVAALGPYAGPPLSPEIKQVFDELARVAQQLADNFYLNHPGMVGAPARIIGSALHTDFANAVKSMHNPRFRIEFARSFGWEATWGEFGSVRNDVEYLDVSGKRVLAVFDYKTTADPDVSPGDMLSLSPRRTRQLRQALAKKGEELDDTIPIVGLRVIVGNMLEGGK